MKSEPLEMVVTPGDVPALSLNGFPAGCRIEDGTLRAKGGARLRIRGQVPRILPQDGSGIRRQGLRGGAG